jgi:hypothetical protein
MLGRQKLIYWFGAAKEGVAFSSDWQFNNSALNYPGVN